MSIAILLIPDSAAAIKALMFRKGRYVLSLSSRFKFSINEVAEISF